MEAIARSILNPMAPVFIPRGAQFASAYLNQGPDTSMDAMLAQQMAVEEYSTSKYVP